MSNAFSMILKASGNLGSDGGGNAPGHAEISTATTIQPGSMSRRKFAALGSFFTLAGPSLKRLAAEESGAVRKPAPDFNLTDAKGMPVKLSDYKGKVVLLNFWATWCGPCQIEIPWFADFARRYGHRHFALLGISMDEEGWKVVRPFLTSKAISYRIVIGDDAVAERYGGVDALPATFLIDRAGRIASSHFGLVSKGDYANEIVKLIAER